MIDKHNFIKLFKQILNNLTLREFKFEDSTSDHLMDAIASNQCLSEKYKVEW